MREIGRKYEWRDTQHGPQLWNLEEKCWSLWYGIGAIGIADYTKAEIDSALNPCWGISDEALAAEKEQVVALTKERDELRARNVELVNCLKEIIPLADAYHAIKFDYTCDHGRDCTCDAESMSTAIISAAARCVAKQTGES